MRRSVRDRACPKAGTPRSRRVDRAYLSAYHRSSFAIGYEALNHQMLKNQRVDFSTYPGICQDSAFDCGTEQGGSINALDLDTPALYVDLDAMERNIRQMQQQCRGWGVELRPHVKTHKIPEIARMQLDAGAIGITVAKVGEAEVLPGDDVLIAYPLLKAKLPRLRELAKKRRIKVAIDSVEVARDLAGIETLVEVDVGVG